MLWWNWRILSNFQSGGLTEIYAGMLSLLLSIGRKSAGSAAKVIAPRGKKPAVEISILHTFGFGGSRDHIRECDSTPAQAMPKYFLLENQDFQEVWDSAGSAESLRGSMSTRPACFPRVSQNRQISAMLPADSPRFPWVKLNSDASVQRKAHQKFLRFQYSIKCIIWHAFLMFPAIWESGDKFKKVKNSLDVYCSMLGYCWG